MHTCSPSDYGARVLLDLLRARGEMGRWFGRDSMERDFPARLAYNRAVETYPFSSIATRARYMKASPHGANRYVELHPDEFPLGFAPHFTGYDVLGARREHCDGGAGCALPRADRSQLPRSRPWRDGNTDEPRRRRRSAGRVDRSTRRRLECMGILAESNEVQADAILLRNPVHLQWDAKATTRRILTVPGVVDYYGDFRIGGPFSVGRRIQS